MTTSEYTLNTMNTNMGCVRHRTHKKIEDSQLTIHKKLNQATITTCMHHFVLCQLVANSVISNMLTANDK